MRWLVCPAEYVLGLSAPATSAAWLRPALQASTCAVHPDLIQALGLWLQSFTVTVGGMLGSSDKQQLSAASHLRTRSRQQVTAPEIEVPQLEVLKQGASAQGTGKSLCCHGAILRRASHVLDACNLCAKWADSQLHDNISVTTADIPQAHTGSKLLQAQERANQLDATAVHTSCKVEECTFRFFRLEIDSASIPMLWL